MIKENPGSEHLVENRRSRRIEYPVIRKKRVGSQSHCDFSKKN